MKTRTLGLLFIGLGAGLILGVVGLWAYPRLAGVDSVTRMRPRVGSAAPNFALKTLDGQAYHLEELRGRSVVVNFWATWCDPCKDEMPLLDQVARAKSDQLLILAVNADEQPTLVRDFQEEYKLSFPLLLDPGSETGDLYLVNAFPTTYFLDTEGIIRAVQIGSMPESVLAEQLAKIGVLD